MNTTTIGTVTHRALTSYECWAGKTTQTDVAYTHMGGAYRAVRFERQDTGCRGIEIYAVNPDGDGLDWFIGYANPAAPADALVIAAIERAMYASDHIAVPADMSERYAALELR